MNERPYKIDWFSGEHSDGEDWLAYASVYMSTVKMLLESFKEEMSSNEISLDRDPEIMILPYHVLGILPILFLFRQYVELELKGLLKINNKPIDMKSHHIYQPLLDVERIAVFSSRISDTTKNFVKELEDLDEKSQAFRYPTDTDGNRFFKSIGILEYINTLSNLEKLILQVMNDFVNLEGDFDYRKENKDESMNYYNPSEWAINSMNKIHKIMKDEESES